MRAEHSPDCLAARGSPDAWPTVAEVVLLSPERPPADAGALAAAVHATARVVAVLGCSHWSHNGARFAYREWCVRLGLGELVAP